MPDHVCPHEKDIGGILRTVKRLEKAIDGNGNEGILTEVTTLKTNFEQMNKDLEIIAKSTSAIAQSQIETDTTERIKAETKTARYNTSRHIATMMGVVISVIGVVYLILDHIGS